MPPRLPAHAALLVAAALLAGAACNLRRTALDFAAPIFADSMKAFDREGDYEVARAAAPSQLELVEGLLVTSPDNRTFLALVARGWGEVAFGFVEDELESLPDTRESLDRRRVLAARATGLYARALAHAAHLLETRHPGFAPALARGGPALAVAIAQTDGDDVAGLTFAGIAIASMLKLNPDDPSRLDDLPKAIDLLERARALDAKYDRGGAPMVLGLIYGSSPPAAGGDPAKARARFAEAIAATDGKYLLPKVVEAQSLAVVTHDRALFERLLREVLATPPDAVPDLRLGNEVARRRAARLVAREDALFK